MVQWRGPAQCSSTYMTAQRALVTITFTHIYSCHAKVQASSLLLCLVLKGIGQQNRKHLGLEGQRSTDLWLTLHFFFFSFKKKNVFNVRI